MHPYHKVRGATVIFGYVNEEGKEVPVRSLPAEFMDPVKIRNQLKHIEEEFCTENAKDYEVGQDTYPRGKAARKLTAQDKKDNKKAEREERKENKYVLEEGSMKDELERRERQDAAGSRKNRQRMTAAAQKRTIQHNFKPGAKDTGERRLFDKDPQHPIKEGVRGDAISESVHGSSLEHAIHSYSLPPHEGGDDDWSHHHYVHRVDKHFKQHLDMHGVGNQLTNKERQYALAHRHLSERGHIAASKHDIAHCNSNSSGLVKHAREKLTNAVYGLGDEAPEHKISSVLMHKVNRKIQDDHEQRARADGREALNAVRQGGIYE